MKNENVKTEFRTEEEKKYLIKRLNVIEGQVRGIKQMIENDRICEEVLMQMSAVDKSLKSIGNILLKNHLSNYTVNDIKNDKIDLLDEIISLFEIINK